MSASSREHAAGAPAALAELFWSTYGHGATRRVRAPGRVNLIGEHVDYLELPVLPMAIEQGVEILLRPRDDGRVRLHHSQAGFEPRELDLSGEIAPFEQGDWGNYAKAAAVGLAREHDLRRGFDGLVGGDLPVAAGLSSSSALVVAVGLALLDVNDLAMEPVPLAALLARAEHYVGTSSGGMDQAASLCGRPGCALSIRFAPLRVEPLALPADWRFVVAHSLVRAEKSGAVRASYNALRAAGEQALAHLTALPDLGASARSYEDLCAGAGATDLIELGRQSLPESYLPAFRHAVTEHARVAEAHEAIARGDGAALGRVMDACHASLRDDLGVSTLELDLLVEAARAGGALGARLTGAGFGGCAVALVSEGYLPRLLESLAERFYSMRPHDSLGHPPVLVVRPSAGASCESVQER